MHLNEVVPWGRNLREYQLIFNLSEEDFQKNILGCGDGPSSFNVEMSNLGKNVTSIDPIYQFTGVEIRQRIKETSSTIISELKKNQKLYKWSVYKNPV